MTDINKLKQMIQEAYDAPLSLVAETAKQVILIERDFFYGDRQNTQRLARIRVLINEKVTNFEPAEQVN